MTRRVQTLALPKEMAEDPSLAFRPQSYWAEDSLVQGLLGNIQGEARRSILLESLNSGDIDMIPKGLLEPVLDHDLREAIGRLHPMFMGGEYLPPYMKGEVEIARICLESTTADVISIRARKLKDGFIHYRVVDEYGTHYKCSPADSMFPLTAGELLQTLEVSGHEGRSLVMGPLIGNLESGADPDHMRGFVTVRSHFYPGLEQHCHERCEAYLDSLDPAEDDDEA